MSAWHVKVYDVLVEECGAHESESARRDFAVCFPECVEYRFQDGLGFGGKVWKNRSKVYVSCYREDKTPERLVMMERANDRLAKIGGDG